MSEREVTRSTAASARDSDGRQATLVATLSWSSEDPLAVTMSLVTRGGTVTWVFAQDLLANGLVAPIGAGSVRVWPVVAAGGAPGVTVKLTQQDASASVQLPRAFVEEFVHAVSAAGGEAQVSALVETELSTLLQ
jgi:hypothetical protein